MSRPPTLAARCRAAGLSYGTALSRMGSGMTSDEALAAGPGRLPRGGAAGAAADRDRATLAAAAALVAATGRWTYPGLAAAMGVARNSARHRVAVLMAAGRWPHGPALPPGHPGPAAARADWRDLAGEAFPRLARLALAAARRRGGRADPDAVLSALGWQLCLAARRHDPARHGDWPAYARLVATMAPRRAAVEALPRLGLDRSGGPPPRVVACDPGRLAARPDDGRAAAGRAS